jgi:hypothetical protein
MQIPAKLPTEKQSGVLLNILDKGRQEGVVLATTDQKEAGS